jgi:hypothetical protein
MRLPGGRPPRLDMYGHNPFSRRFPHLRETPYAKGLRDINDVDTLENEVRRVYHRRVPLWLSEFTISSDRKSRGFDFYVSRGEQARWVSAAFRLAGAASYIAGLGWYTLYDEPRSVAQGLTNGLLTAGGKHKPAFAAYQRAR